MNFATAILQASANAARLSMCRTQGQAVSGTVSLRSVSSIATRSVRHISASRGSQQLRSLAVYAYRPEVQMQESGSGRKFADFAVYKGKGALCLKVIKPTWDVTSNGNKSITRAGVMLLEFAASAGQSQTSFGNRSYDWSKKQVMALTVVELGNILAAEPGTDIQMYHDPGKGTDMEGRSSKQLKIQSAPDGKGGFMFNFQVKDVSIPSGQFFITVPLTAGEMFVLKNLANFAVPRLLGFDEVLSGFDTV